MNYKIKYLIKYIEEDLEPQIAWLRGEILKLYRDANQINVSQGETVGELDSRKA